MILVLFVRVLAWDHVLIWSEWLQVHNQLTLSINKKYIKKTVNLLETNDTTNHGNGWRKDVVNWYMEFAANYLITIINT